MTKPPVTWCQVLEDEYRALHGVEPLDGPAPADGPADGNARIRALHQRIQLIEAKQVLHKFGQGRLGQPRIFVLINFEQPRQS